MNYRDTLHAIDTGTALGILEIPFENKGAYLSMPCDCGQKAVVKSYGEKKNLIYCPKCKKGSNILKMAMESRKLNWQAVNELLAKAIVAPSKPIAEELSLNYELEHNKFLEDQGFTSDFCKAMGVGQPKGRTMLAGCIAFTVFDEAGKRIAYYGINMKDRKPKFHSSFNPESYLYLYNTVDKESDVVICTDMFLCLKSLAEKKQAVSTFGLPYLSQKHLELLNRCLMITVFRADIEIVRQISAHYNGYVRFI